MRFLFLFFLILCCACRKEIVELKIDVPSTDTIKYSVSKDVLLVDFWYGINFSSSTSNYLSVSDGSTFIPSNSEYEWIFDGTSVSNSNYFSSKSFSKSDGIHTIGLTIVTPDKIKYSKSKVFQIRNNALISSEFPADTTKALIPVVDFEFGVDFSSSSTLNYLSVTDGSTSIPSNSNYKWIFDGATVSNYNYFSSKSFSKADGFHTVGLTIETPDKITYSKSKVFQIRNNSIISPEFPIDTTKTLIPVVDFAFGVDFSSSTTYNFLSVTDGSTSIPSNSDYKWVLDGVYVSSSNYFSSQAFSKADDFHTLGLTIETPDKITYSKSKVFQIRNNAVISSEFPSDTAKTDLPLVDFTYSITFSSDSAYINIGLTDASNNIGTSDYLSYWYINGSKIYNSNQSSYDFKNYSIKEYENGFYSINHEIIVNNISYTKYREFEITGIK